MYVAICSWPLQFFLFFIFYLHLLAVLIADVCFGTVVNTDLVLTSWLMMYNSHRMANL